jgi:hypothetical protein
MIPMDKRFEEHFLPTMVTDKSAGLHPDLKDDLALTEAAAG